MFDGLRAAFVARGADLVTATSRAQAALFGMVQQQAAMISFLHAFQLLAIVFVAMIPLVFVMRKPRHHEGPAAVAGE